MKESRVAEVSDLAKTLGYYEGKEVKEGETGRNEDVSEFDGVIGRAPPLHTVRVIRGCAFRQQQIRAPRS